MANVKINPIVSQTVWDEFIGSYPDSNFLHSWEWGKFYQRLGQTVLRYGFYHHENLTGIMLAVVETAKRATYLTVAGGPLFNWQSSENITAWINLLKSLARDNGCAFVRVRPQLPNTAENQKLFRDLGFRPALMHLHAELTNQLDLSKSEPELLAGMRKSTRYEIRKAEKLGIEITASADTKIIDSFYNLQAETAKRQNFVPFSRSYLKNQFAVFSKNGQALLYSSFHERKLLAQAFIIFYGEEAVYHYGASAEAGRDYPGAYAIQWAAIREAKNRGMKRYNFWGIAPPDQPEHRFASLSTFKRGFGGTDIAYLPAHDLILDRVKYSLNSFVENIRKKTRRL